MTARVSEVIRGWLGWCPNARISTTTQPGMVTPPRENPTILSDGGPSGSGRIRRGKDIAATSIKILVRNRQLLWFSFLMLLTFLLTVVTDWYIPVISGTNAFPVVMNPPVILWVALTFTAAFIGIFVFFYLAAGLITCVLQIQLGNSISLREGLSRAWNHKRSIAGWTLIGALLWIPAGPFAIGFYLVTVFALPAIVLDNKDLVGAIRESVFIFRRIWVETYVSFGIVLLISIGFVYVTLFSLGQVAIAYGLIIGGILAGIIGLVVYVFMAICLVVMGIATFFLYTYEKTGYP
ncbi:MAG TPA: hypothetical protein PKM50_09420 [Methanoregula sp.]|nr:hypothetical protein [Methanoregula sp.]